MKSSSELEDEWNDMERSVEEELLPERISFRLTSKEDASKNKDIHFLLRVMKQISINRILEILILARSSTDTAIPQLTMKCILPDNHKQQLRALI